MANNLLRVENISKDYEGRPLLRDISFDVAAGEIVCILGPSGTGKTTLLRIIAGLEEADAGRVVFETKDLANVPPHKRGMGMMFQDLALFPHRNVFDNVAFGLRMQGASAGDLTARVNETLELVGLDAKRFARRDVNSLSGGEQQRVALARTLAPRPRLIMFDEPLGALDRILREELVYELHQLLKRLHMTALYVTHDQDEAFAIADRLVLLNQGHIEQQGTPIELYQHPSSGFAARFMGLTNLVENSELEIGDGVWERSEKTATTADGQETANGVVRVKTKEGVFWVKGERAVKDARFVLLRPRAVELIVEKSERTENILNARIVETQWRGGHPWIMVAAQEGMFAFEWDDPVAVGSEVVLELKESEIELLRA